MSLASAPGEPGGEGLVDRGQGGVQLGACPVEPAPDPFAFQPGLLVDGQPPVQFHQVGALGGVAAGLVLQRFQGKPCGSQVGLEALPQGPPPFFVGQVDLPLQQLVEMAFDRPRFPGGGILQPAGAVVVNCAAGGWPVAALDQEPAEDAGTQAEPGPAQRVVPPGEGQPAGDQQGDRAGHRGPGPAPLGGRPQPGHGCMAGRDDGRRTSVVRGRRDIQLLVGRQAREAVLTRRGGQQFLHPAHRRAQRVRVEGRAVAHVAPGREVPLGGVGGRLGGGKVVREGADGLGLRARPGQGLAGGAEDARVDGWVGQPGGGQVVGGDGQVAAGRGEGVVQLPLPVAEPGQAFEVVGAHVRQVGREAGGDLA